MNKIIHFFDLDNTLWSIDTNLWLIRKNDPSKPLMILPKIESIYILNGIYKNQENLIEYNGENFWISDDLFEKIKKKRKSITLDQLGISFIEKTNPKYYEKYKFYIENIRHLRDSDNADFGILSARYSIENDHHILMSLKDKLNDIGIDINKFYYTSDHFNYKNTNKVNIDKMKVLLEHMVGYHIKGDHFEPIKQNFYQEIHFYDDEFQNINVANDIQMFLEQYLENTDDEVYDRIINRIINEKPTLYTHLITNNQLNRFDTTTIILKQPEKFPIKIQENKSIKRFNEFKKL